MCFQCNATQLSRAFFIEECCCCCQKTPSITFNTDKTIHKSQTREYGARSSQLLFGWLDGRLGRDKTATYTQTYLSFKLFFLFHAFSSLMLSLSLSLSLSLAVMHIYHLMLRWPKGERLLEPGLPVLWLVTPGSSKGTTIHLPRIIRSPLQLL
jgi:hypothetical protein